MSEPLISVKGVSKRYCRNLRKSLTQGVEDIARECLCLQPRKGLRDGEFWANRDISFDLRRGECLGLIGGNGAGKSTLLKMLAGLTKPDEGEIHINGRVGALIELGAGFNPLLSGRENVYVNGAVLGMGKKEVDRKLDSILEFADIGEFIDAPVQSYSSGMKVRLGFAIAVHMEPDILLIDEVLAVGDLAFRIKCYSTLATLMPNTCVIFVSHSLGLLNRYCTAGLYLEKGSLQALGTADYAIGCYLATAKVTTHLRVLADEGYKLLGQPLDIEPNQGSLSFSHSFLTPKPNQEYGYKGQIKTSDGHPLATFSGNVTSNEEGVILLNATVNGANLAQGHYSIDLSLLSLKPRSLKLQAQDCVNICVSSSSGDYGQPSILLTSTP